MDYFEVPIVELPEARTSKIRDLTRPRSEDRFSYAGAAEDCLQEECSVDTVQMLVGQLKTREQELAKKGRIVDYEREAALAGVRTMIHDLEGADAASSLFSRHRRGGGWRCGRVEFRRHRHVPAQARPTRTR